MHLLALLASTRMLSSSSLFGNSIISTRKSVIPIGATTTNCHRSFRFKSVAFLKPSISVSDGAKNSSVLLDSLRILEWDKLCDSVASFAGTPLGRQATKDQLWSLNQTYEDSMRLLGETNAAVEILKHGGCSLDFHTLDVLLVKSAIQNVRRGLPVDGSEALAVLVLLQFADNLKLGLTTAIKEDEEWYTRFMPLSEVIMGFVINRSLVKLIQQVIDEDGSVKDSASPNLKRLRGQLLMLERKVYQLIESLIRKEANETSSPEVTNINGRWCIRSVEDQPRSIKGLLLASGSGLGSIVEPLAAVPLNDELQQARSLVAKAEEDVLLKLTEKMLKDIEDVENLLKSTIRLDVCKARASHSISFGGTCPDLFIAEDADGYFTTETHLSRSRTSKESFTFDCKRKWILYLPKAYHPLLLQQHRQKLQKAKKDVSSATAEIRRRRLQGENLNERVESDMHLSSLKMQVTKLEENPPVPVNFFIGWKTRVLVITGPNTGGKTICLKTVGLAATMAKSGLHVLSSEPVHIPWFDSVFADIGDEQSLSQSLSTFSGHLKQISAIQAHATSQSLVLLDEVGAGTNPIEGAALGMSLLESFAESGALLTISTTHHGELKTLKYSNAAFENACMEFDEENLQPTYKILWGVPGRSNAISIAERLGLPSIVLDKARELYGAASAEINEVIIDMEKSKQDFQEHIHEVRHHLMLSRDLHKKLLIARKKITEHETSERYRKMQEITAAASMARMILNKKVRQARASTPIQPSQTPTEDHRQPSLPINSLPVSSEGNVNTSSPSEKSAKKLTSDAKTDIPKVGDTVSVYSLRKQATVLKVEPLKEEILVQAGNMKLKLKLSDLRT